MQLEEKTRFALSTIRPMAEFTLPYLASVIGVIKPDRGAHVGSAVRCRLGGRCAVMTAAHVIRQAREDYPDFALSAGFGDRPWLVRGDWHMDEEADLAVMFLPPEYPAEDRLDFWPEERIDWTNERLAKDYLFLHGFPQSPNYSSPLLGGVVSKSLPYGAMQRLKEEGLPENLEPFQFAVYFDPGSIHVEPGEPADLLPEPYGMSGCPVWRIGASGRSAKEWEPEWSLLVGIVTQWRTDAEILVATGTPKLIELVNRFEKIG